MERQVGRISPGDQAAGKPDEAGLSGRGSGWSPEGWRGYFGFGETPSRLGKLDSWLRRRLRMVFWRQWKRGRTRFAALRRLGVGREPAAKTAGNAHGPWRLSRSPALSFALPNSYFISLGLPRLAPGR